MIGSWYCYKCYKGDGIRVAILSIGAMKYIYFWKLFLKKDKYFLVLIMFEKEIVIDGKGHLLGRLASYVAKEL